jgi:hypothetical protein
MRRTSPLLATVSVIALCAFGALTPALAQTGLVGPREVTTDPSIRVRAETALLYADTLDRLTQIIERDVAADPGVSVITGLRAGRIDALPSLDPELRDLITSLRIGALVMDADPDPVRTDERAIVFIADGDLRNGVTRSDIEAAARDARLRTVARLQDRQIQGPDGFFEIPAGMTGLPGAAVAAYVGVRGADLVTSSGVGSEGFRTVACPAGQFGTGIVERRDLERTATLGGTINRTPAAWMEMSRSCAPEYARTIQIFDTCSGPDGRSGMAVFNVTQRVLRDPADPFGTVVLTDEATRTQVDDGACLVADRLEGTTDLLVEGGLTARRELELRTATSISDLGAGVNRVPRIVAGEPGAGGPVAGIPFPARSVSDFEFLRTCAQEYGPVPLPAGTVNTSGTGTGSWSGSDAFTGDVTWHRDYNRRETTFTDDPLAYILNYDLVLDPNPFGWPARGRQRVPTTFGSAPEGDGWYRSGQVCERDITRSETQTATLSCPGGYPAFPLGTYQERRDGMGAYAQQVLVSGNVQPPAHFSTAWGDWSEISNACYNQTATRTDETRTVRTSSGSQTCDQSQRRTRVDTTNTFQRGGSNLTTAFDPDWTNDGAATNCVTNYDSGGGGGGGEMTFADIDGDGRGDMQPWQADNLGLGYDLTRTYSPSAVAAAIESAARSVNSLSDSTDENSGSGESCFAAGTPVLMADGTERAIETIRLGDILADGGRVILTGLFLASDLFRLDGVEVTGAHLVRGDTGWVPVRSHPRAVRILSGERLVHNIASTRNRIRAGGLLFADYAEISGPLLEDLLVMAEMELSDLRAVS